MDDVRESILVFISKWEGADSDAYICTHCVKKEKYKSC